MYRPLQAPTTSDPVSDHHLLDQADLPLPVCFEFNDDPTYTPTDPCNADASTHTPTVYWRDEYYTHILTATVILKSTLLQCVSSNCLVVL